MTFRDIAATSRLCGGSGCSQGITGIASRFSEDASNEALLCWEKSLHGSPSESVFNPSYSEVRMAQATTLQPRQIRHLLRVTSATSRHPERDCPVLLLGLTARMRVTEIAQIEVQDVLFHPVRCARKLACAQRLRGNAGSAASTWPTPRPSRR